MDRHLSRRGFFGSLAAAGAGAALVTGSGLIRGGGTAARAAQETPVAGVAGATPDTGTGPFMLVPLPYDNAALEPHIEARTMRIHHNRHHATYVKNLNAAVQDAPDLAAMSPEDLIRNLGAVPEDTRGVIRNNAGGHVNHTMFWEIMGPDGGAPAGDLLAAIDADLGGVAPMTEAVTKAGLGRFGSGWAWVVVGADGKLAVTSTPNQDNPLMSDLVDVPGAPILGVDVWEHAYYLQYQNKRADYLAAWFNVVNWAAVEARLTAARG